MALDERYCCFVVRSAGMRSADSGCDSRAQICISTVAVWGLVAACGGFPQGRRRAHSALLRSQQLGIMRLEAGPPLQFRVQQTHIEAARKLAGSW